MNRRNFLKSLIITPAFTFIPLQLLAKHLDAKNEKTVCIKELGAQSNLPNFDNREIIQKAIDICAEKYSQENKRWSIYIPMGVFYMSATPYFEESTKAQIGICCLILKSNICITGPGTLKLMGYQYGKGAFFRILGSYRDNSSRLNNLDITEITIDGNAENQVPNIQASNLLLECSENITIQGINSINANGNGILLRGSTTRESAMKNVNIIKCTVNACSKIGIQAAQFSDLMIEGNNISNCGDNGIDIYGDMGVGTYPNLNGNNFIIRKNRISNCSNGIFPETVANGEIYDNEIKNSLSSAIHINRIHGLPQNILIRNNISISSDYGVSLTGDMMNININDNEFRDVRKSFISLGSGNGNSSNISATRNKLYLNSETQSIVVMNGATIRKININENFIITTKKIKSVNEMLVSNNARKIDDSVRIQNWKIL
jgi:hypothetical protein